MALLTVHLHAEVLDTAALQKVIKKAVNLMDRNLPTEAIIAWDEAIALRPDFLPYKYERTICLMMDKKYSQAQVELLGMYRDTSLFDRGFQLLGNCYDFLGDTSKARSIYREGLQAWPKSGRLHLELGNASYLDNNPKAALEWWAKGARAEPQYPSNYYQIATTFAFTPYRFWALLYGEAFLNLERGSQRFAEVSSLLFQIWQKGINPGTSDPVHFASAEVIEQASDNNPTAMSFPMAFDYTVAAALAIERKNGTIKDSVKLGTAQLVALRSRFLKLWKESGYFEKYPNDILDFNATVQHSGWLNEYLWWLYSFGDKAASNQNYQTNETRYDTFLAWFGDHLLDAEKPLCVGFQCQ
mgnify:CR=1 FL=1